MFSKTTVEMLKNRAGFESLQLTFSWLDQEMVCGGGGSSGYGRGLSGMMGADLGSWSNSCLSTGISHWHDSVKVYCTLCLYWSQIIFGHLTCSSKNNTMKKVLWLSLILQKENFNKVFKSYNLSFLTSL